MKKTIISDHYYCSQFEDSVADYEKENHKPRDEKDYVNILRKNF